MATRLVLGIGNLLMGDEGVGVRAIEFLQQDVWPEGVCLLDGGTGGFHLLDYLSSNEPLVMIDATMDGQPAGTVTTLRPKYASDFPRALTAHDIGLRDLVEAAQLTGALPDIDLVTVSIDAITPMHLTLSAPVQASLPAVRAALARQEAVGHA
jgi:hydrogenase maturation protease